MEYMFKVPVPSLDVVNMMTSQSNAAFQSKEIQRISKLSISVDNT